jgi:peptidoglycan/LPS O-acetylase OafA/YrhL
LRRNSRLLHSLEVGSASTTLGLPTAATLVKGPNRLQSLDVLRGIAALAVVFFHWQHVQLLGGTKLTWPPLSDLTNPEPFEVLLRPIYEYGLYAVDLFFLLSGFVFYWLYRKPIEAKSITLLQFSVARFSRLYPLHLAALLTVGVLEFWFHALSGQFYIYPANDSMHFVMSLFFIQLSGQKAAFNGPEWSLFIELLMYAAFFSAARMGVLRYNIGSIAGIALGLLLWHLDKRLSLARGLCGFFLGGITFTVYSLIVSSSRARVFFFALVGLTLLAWSAVLANIYTGGLVRSYLAPFGVLNNDKGLLLAILYGLFPISILTAALLESLWNVPYTRLAWLGEASYSSYLLHFPLQLVLAIAVYLKIISVPGSQSTISLLAYIAVLLPLSILVFRRFERPMQNRIRSIGRGPRLTNESRPTESD